VLPKRSEHCELKILNREGRCIAQCAYNDKTHYEVDCIGKSGKTEGQKEVDIADSLKRIRKRHGKNS